MKSFLTYLLVLRLAPCCFCLMAIFGQIEARAASPPAGDRFSHLDRVDPYHPGLESARLTTPQWVGEAGVEAVVVLAIDDMRGHEKWEAFLRPILDRLKQIDGRAALSIMTCQIDPNQPHLQQWLQEGVSLECHTIDHPCPLLNGSDFAKAKSTYDRCVDLLSSVPNQRPVAFRMPCCDSQNTVSPRFFTEIFSQRTPAGAFLELDSSVFQIFTPDDPALAHELTTAADGAERFRKYLPFPSFVNTIENYPYPYVIGGNCWEFPCMVPSDWEAQNILQPANPRALADMQAALDATVAKQGVMNFVFHPYGWIHQQQVVELVDYAQRKYGPRVKFLNFRECAERLAQHLTAGKRLRAAAGGGNGVAIVDLNDDGYQDVVIGNKQLQRTRLWHPEERQWQEFEFPFDLQAHGPARWGVIDGQPVVLVTIDGQPRAWRFAADQWQDASAPFAAISQRGGPLQVAIDRRDAGVRFRDLDRDGCSELIIANQARQEVLRWTAAKADQPAHWAPQPCDWPENVVLVDDLGRDAGVRLVDLDDDQLLDLVVSNEQGYAVHRFAGFDRPWQAVLAESRPEGKRIPSFVRAGTNNGAWIHSRHFWWQNEDTDRLPDLVDRVAFNDLLDGVESAARSPAAALAALDVRPGFRVEQMAAEPAVADPIAFDWGPDGDLWVVEMADYPDGVDGQPAGRVRRLVDTDGDGRYDRATTLVDQLRYPTSVMSWRDGVLVLAPPDLFFAKDTNGDGAADQRETLFTGFAEGNPQHQANGLTWGLDNWIYGANGDSGGKIRSIKTGEEVSIGGRDFRLRPDDGALEAIEGYTQFNRNRDDWGNWFGNNNINPMWQYVLSDHYLSRNPHLAPPDGKVAVSEQPGAAPVFPRSRLLERFNDPHTANHFTSACGTNIYRDELLGPGFAGNAFVCEPVHNLVHREIMRRDGLIAVSRRADDEQRSEFLASTDNWFRPTTVRTGPDGALWIADMYRAVIEHTEWIPDSMEERIDVRGGADEGRVYRVLPVGVAPRPMAKLSHATNGELVAQLESPNGWVRDKAQQILVERQATDTAALLESMVQSGGRATARLHALCALDGLGTVRPDILMSALADSEGGVRRHAVRIAEPYFAASPPLQTAILKLVEDPDPQVRLQLAYSLGQWEGEAAGKALGRLAVRDAGDSWILAAAMSSAVPHLESIVTVVSQTKEAAAGQSELISQLLTLAAATHREDTIVALIPVIRRAEQGRYSAWQLGALGELLDLLDRRETTLAKFRASASPPLQAEIDGLAPLFAFARATAGDPSAALDDRLAAVRLLGRGLTDQEADAVVLAERLTPGESEAVRAAAIENLGGQSGEQVARVLLDAWRGYTPQSRGEALDVLLSREPWAAALLDAIDAGRVPPSEIDITRRQQLTTGRAGDLRDRARKIFDQASGDRAAVVTRYLAEMPAGDPARGEPLFVKSCSVCHRFKDKGFAIGPDLSALTEKAPEALAIAILDPNRAIEARFINYAATTTSGLVHAGILAMESGNSLTLLAQENKQQTILRTELEALESTGKSLMPEGFEKDFAPQQLADVIAYLRQNVTRPKELPGNQPVVVVPEALRGFMFCLPGNAEVYGASLRIEEAHGNLGWWAGEDDHVTWTIDVPRDMEYSVHLDIACDDASAGNQWLLECAGQRITATVQSTGGWEKYHRVHVGSLRLKKGQHRLGLRSNGPIHGAMFDLRSITLIPFAGLSQ